MADPEPPAPETPTEPPLRVFINGIDTYSSGNIAQFLCQGGPPAPEDEEEEEEEEEEGPHLTAALQVVGTVSGRSGRDRPHVLEEYLNLERDQLLSRLMDCDVVVYNVSQQAEQVEEAAWAVTALHGAMSLFRRPKLFILVSTVMTWARSKPADPEDPELPLTDQLFWSRRAHPAFSRHLELERRVVRLGRTNRALFSSYVVASGLQYGMGEQVFHHFFKESWLGRVEEVSLFGDGSNVVPTIHIADLSSVLRVLIRRRPKPDYLLALDSSHSRMEEIVKAVAVALGPGKICKRPSEEAFLLQDLSALEMDSLSVDLRMEAVHIRKLLSFRWLCESGLVQNLELVVDQYRQSRGLQPVRLCVLGPPAVGKTQLSQQICQRYQLHHIILRDTVLEAIARMEETLQNSDPDVGDSADTQEQLSNLKDSLEQEGASEEQLKVLKEKLASNPCRNQGFVLDDFPHTYEQAKELFGEEQEPGSRSTMPDLVLFLDAPDDFLVERVVELPEWLVQEQDYEPQVFLGRLAAYRESSLWDDTVAGFFSEQDVPPLSLDVSSSAEPGCSLLQKVLDTIGPPRTYGPSPQELEQELRRRAEEAMSIEAQKKAEEDRKEQEEARSREERWRQWARALEAAGRQQEARLEELSGPMRSYLLEQVSPTLVQGLVQCCRAQPPDPVDFLAEFLFQNNPFCFPSQSQPL
ncbi:adenylate kinase 7-like isoform 2-T2 [Menidia menidia]